MTEPTGLTAFIIGMLKTPSAKLAAADITKLADRYGIPIETAAGYIAIQVGRR